MSTIWFRWHAEFTGSAQRAADKHFCVSKITGVGGGNRQHLMEHCPGSPSLLLLPGGTEGKGRERGEGREGVTEEGRQRGASRRIEREGERE